MESLAEPRRPQRVRPGLMRDEVCLRLKINADCALDGELTAEEEAHWVGRTRGPDIQWGELIVRGRSVIRPGLQSAEMND